MRIISVWEYKHWPIDSSFNCPIIDDRCVSRAQFYFFTKPKPEEEEGGKKNQTKRNEIFTIFIADQNAFPSFFHCFSATNQILVYLYRSSHSDSYPHGQNRRNEARRRTKTKKTGNARSTCKIFAIRNGFSSPKGRSISGLVLCADNRCPLLTLQPFPSIDVRERVPPPQDPCSISSMAFRIKAPGSGDGQMPQIHRCIIAACVRLRALWKDKKKKTSINLYATV